MKELPNSCSRSLSKENPVVVIWLHRVLIQSGCSMHVVMLLVSTAKLLPTTLLIFLLLQLRINIGTLFVLPHFGELRESHEPVVMLLLQHWHMLHRVLPINLRWFIGILRIFNLHSIDLAVRFILFNWCTSWMVASFRRLRLPEGSKEKLWTAMINQPSNASKSTAVTCHCFC